MDWFYSRVHRTERVKAGRMEEEKREETRKKERKQRGKQRGTEEAWGNNKIAGVLPSGICNTIDQPLLGFDFFDSASFASIFFFFFGPGDLWFFVSNPPPPFTAFGSPPLDSYPPQEVMAR